MQYKIDMLPQYREAGADGFIGLKGVMNYCQDAATWHMHKFGLGNDRLIDKYGIAWMFTKCHVSLYDKGGYAATILVETGMTDIQKAKVDRDFRITQEGRLLATARIENCLYHLHDNRLCRLQEIGFPDIEPDTPLEDTDIIKIKRDISGMEKIYERKVLYSNLDKSMHMNNLHYTDLFMDAFPPEFYEEKKITGYDINYISQGFYGDVLSVHMKQDADVYDMAAVNEEGKIITMARIRCE